MKTTAVFSHQEETGVVIFVVSAENHFTLSAKEFLFTASNEKAYLFIVVNKYDQIRDKAKCRRLILDQIKQLSLRTYEDTEDLVHFVDSSAAFHHNGTESFDALEMQLRSFVLVKRSKSKLAPVSTYLSNILSDVDLLAAANSIVAQVEHDKASTDLDRSKLVLEKMQKEREVLDDSLANIEEVGATTARLRAKEIITDALNCIEQGKLGVDERKVALRMPTYPGLLELWRYAQDVRRVLLASVDLAVKMAEEEARIITTKGVKELSQLEDKMLPEGIEHSRRVFMPEAMFSTHGAQRGSRRASRHGHAAVVAGGSHGLGISLAHQPDMLETSIFDIFDAQYHIVDRFRSHQDLSEGQEEAARTALSVASVSLGALTMVSGLAMGIQGLIGSVYRIAHVFSNESARKWAVPVITVVGLGATVYLVWELPHSVPHNIGRRIHANLAWEHPELAEAILRLPRNCRQQPRGRWREGRAPQA
jgi:mitofusin 2